MCTYVNNFQNTYFVFLFLVVFHQHQVGILGSYKKKKISRVDKHDSSSTGKIAFWKYQHEKSTFIENEWTTFKRAMNGWTLKASSALMDLLFPWKHYNTPLFPYMKSPWPHVCFDNRGLVIACSALSPQISVIYGMQSLTYPTSNTRRHLELISQLAKSRSDSDNN